MYFEFIIRKFVLVFNAIHRMVIIVNSFVVEIKALFADYKIMGNSLMNYP